MVKIEELILEPRKCIGCDANSYDSITFAFCQAAYFFNGLNRCPEVAELAVVMHKEIKKLGEECPNGFAIQGDRVVRKS
jgi:hypothetical protein